MTIHKHVLKGCAPTPLANYLKALGILRLVGEQADKKARGWWDGEHFCLLTQLSKEKLEVFFLEEYKPTPMLSPWNKGCGFFKEDDPGLRPLEISTATRFQRFRDGTAEARKLLDEISNADASIRAIKARTKTGANGFQSEAQRKRLESNETYRSLLQKLQEQCIKPDLASEDRAILESDIKTINSLIQEAPSPPTKKEAELLKESSGYKRILAALDRKFKELKAALIPDCRRLWRGLHADWLSAAVVLNEAGEPEWPSLLGTGGNDGNLDFTNNFMQQLGTIFDLASSTGSPTSTAIELLANALCLEPANHLTNAAVGQYQPGSAGGANSSTGFASGNLVNPWDFVLMMEGAILFTSRSTRRLDPSAFSKAAAPFAVRPHAAGYATPGSEKAQRGEQWMPLWSQPATLNDVAAMFGEARVQLGRQIANRPIDSACAISRLGVARGISSFVRFGYLERNGQATLAIPLGKIQVQQQPRSYLIDDLAGWLERIQRNSRDKNAPARLVHAERYLSNSVFAAITHDYTPGRWQAILLAAAGLEALQANGSAIEAGPIPPLNPKWVEAVFDESPEVRLALALGGAATNYSREGHPFDPIRHHWLPLERGARRFQTRDKRLVKDPRVVMAGRDPIADLCSLVERRLIEAGMNGQRRLPLVAASGCSAGLNDLATFLSGSLDLEKLLNLARAFMAIKWDQWTRDHCPQTPSSTETPEETWLTVRLACLPRPVTKDKDIPADGRIVRLLNSGNASRAIEIARQRLKSAGIRPPLQGGITDSVSARRWAAALAFPINLRSTLRAAAILDPSMKGKLHVR